MGSAWETNGAVVITPPSAVNVGNGKVFVERRRRPNPVRIIRWNPFDNKLANRLMSGYGGQLARRFCSFDIVDKSLHVDLRSVDGDHVRIGAWDKGLKTQCWADEYGWIDQELDFGFPLFACRESYDGVFTGNNGKNAARNKDGRSDAVELFSRSIPAQIREAAEPFGVCLLLVLRTLRECPAHLALVRENPVLVFLAGQRFYETECGSADRTAEFMKLLFQKRRSIAEFAIGNNSDKIVRLLSKIRLDRYDWQAAGDIIRFLDNNEVSAAIAPYRVIPELFLREIESNPAILKIRLFGPDGEMFENGFNRDAFCEALKLRAECSSISAHLGRNVSHRAAKCGTLIELRRLHDKIVEEMHRMSEREFKNKIQEQYGSIAFPEPPYAGNDAISPLTTAIELYNEGISMHHCVAAFCEKVAIRELYFYRLVHPQRATLELVRDGKEWHIGQMKLACNAAPSNESRAAAEKWLSERKHECMESSANEKRA